MEEIEKIGTFNLYDRVRIKGTKITGNIVNIYNEIDCLIEYDRQFDKKNCGVYDHNINELEKE